MNLLSCDSTVGAVIGFYTVPIVWVIMAAFAPIAWPISFVLDIVLGPELGQIYTRDMVQNTLSYHSHLLSPSLLT